MKRSCVILFWAALICLGVYGCRNRDSLNTAIVQGKVVNSGKPVTEAEVSFVSPAGPKATGYTSTDGTFELMISTGKSGAMVGPNAVEVVTGLPKIPTDVDPNFKGFVPLIKSNDPFVKYRFNDPILVQNGTNEIVLDVGQATAIKMD